MLLVLDYLSLCIAVGCCLLLMVVVDWRALSVFVVGRGSLFVVNVGVCCVLLVACCFLFVVRCALSAVSCLLVVACCS